MKERERQRVQKKKKKKKKEKRKKKKKKKKKKEKKKTKKNLPGGKEKQLNESVVGREGEDGGRPVKKKCDKGEPMPK